MKRDSVLAEYDASLDAKRRCVIKGNPSIGKYHITVMSSGTVVMEPRVLASLNDLSVSTRKQFLSSVQNFKKGKVGGEFNPQDDPATLKEILEEDKSNGK